MNKNPELRECKEIYLSYCKYLYGTHVAVPYSCIGKLQAEVAIHRDVFPVLCPLLAKFFPRII